MYRKGTRTGGVSKRITVVTTAKRREHRTVYRAGCQRKRMDSQAAVRQSALAGLSYKDREAVEEMDASMYDHDDSWAFDSVPLGEEAFDLSHAGGEHNEFMDVANTLTSWAGIRRPDARERIDRINRRTAQWNLQIDALVDAYLKYRLHEGEDQRAAVLPDEETTDRLHIDVVDIFYRKSSSFGILPKDEYPNVTLVRNGYIGSSPLYPTVAISLRTLATYRQTHRVCPRYSLQSEARKLCHLHSIPYQRYLRDQLSVAYDIYLQILRQVDNRIKVVLGRNEPNWRLKNVCPPCFYKLQGEPPLEHSFHCEMDGNNSAKRSDALIRQKEELPDSRRLSSDRWLSREEVDRFKDEVRTRTVQSGRTTKHGDDDEFSADWEVVPEDDPVAICISRWKNASPEQRKRMFSMFSETGIFITACRHGFVLLVCDMVRSGELAKYPLAMANKLMEVYGEDIGCGYDIGCAFSKTLDASSLGPAAREKHFRCFVGAFHGHAHNRACQLEWLPLHVKGAGRSDFEGCERVFSASDELAPSIRHASLFHFHQALLEHFGFWDEDKYAQLGRYLLNHYNEALEITTGTARQLNGIQSELNISDEDFEEYLRQEKEYLRGLKNEPPEETLQFVYVERLQELENARIKWDQARAAASFIVQTPATVGIRAAQKKANRAVTTTYNRLQRAEANVAQIEDQLCIEARWTSDCPEYNDVVSNLAHRNYRLALDELERLVVQRLFELSKLNMSRTGYKLRVHISKALQRRADAIRNALDKYNEVAKSVSMPTITWKEIVEYTFLGEFDLLRNSRNDIRNAAWAEPKRREATVMYLQVRQAHAEIARLNVEISRLHTAIHDETILMNEIISKLRTENPALCSEICRQWKVRSMVNALHLHFLNRIEQLDGFSGKGGVGVRLGSDTCHMDTVLDSAASEVMDEVHLAGERDEEDVIHDLNSFMNFQLSINE